MEVENDGGESSEEKLYYVLCFVSGSIPTLQRAYLRLCSTFARKSVFLAHSDPPKNAVAKKLETLKSVESLAEGQKLNSRRLYTLQYRSNRVPHPPVTFLFWYQIPRAGDLVDSLLNKKIGLTKSIQSSDWLKFKVPKRVKVAPKFYPTQEAVAQAILEKMSAKFKFDNFERFDYIIVTPPRNSLFGQTSERLEEILPGRSASKVITPKPSADHTKNWTEFVEKVCREKTTFFLIIVDEAHWGMANKGELDNMLNRPEVANVSNVFYLYVTATPANLLVQNGFNETNLIDWQISCRGIENSYVGFEELRAEQKIICEQRDLKNFYADDIEWFLLQQSEYKMDMAELGVMFDYLVTLFQMVRLKTNFNTRVAIELRSLLESKGSMIVVRMNTVLGANLFVQKLRDMRAFLKISNFAIINDTEETSGDTLKSWSLYEDLKTLACLVVVVDKGRMGDTFPANSFKLFDIRSRYYRQVGDKSTLIQDCGRATGYGTRPYVLLSQKANLVITGQKDVKPGRYCQKKPSDMEEDDDDSETEEDSIGEEASESLEEIEQSEIRSLITSIQQYWSPSAKNYLNNVDLNQRFLLTAPTQCGKTGAFLRLILDMAYYFRTPGGRNNEAKRLSDEFEEIHNRFDEVSGETAHVTQTLMQLWPKYHQLFKALRQSWTVLPIKFCFEQLVAWKGRAKGNGLIVGDFGCGPNAELASNLRKVPGITTVHSFDHYRAVECTDVDFRVCSLEKVPLNPATLDAAVFSLSLIGTNYKSYIDEACRVLKPEGFLCVVDVWDRLDSVFIDYLKREFDFVVEVPMYKQGQFRHFKCITGLKKKNDVEMDVEQFHWS